MSDSDEFIPVHHPETGNDAEVTRFGFENLWKDKGWVEVSPDADLSKVSAAALDEIAAEHGVDVSAAKTKADKARAIKEGAANGND